jgi:drug/metabolite transporter (DMT)-like permease
MNGILLILIIAGVTLQQVMKKAYNNRVSGGVFSFAAGSSLVALLFFAITSGGNLKFSGEFVIYSVLFALAFSTSTVFSFLAIVEGPLALTSLMIQYSLLIPTVYGLLALGEPIGVYLIVGIVFLMISLLLINIEKKGEKKKITFKWAVYAFLAFVGNGGCSLVQKVQQVACNKQFKSEFMLLAYAMAVVVLLLCALFFEKKDTWKHIKSGFGFWAANGAFNGMVNFLVLVLSGVMAASVMFPLISAGGIIATFFVSLFVYREKLSTAQTVGLALGIISVVFLNL